MTEKRKQDNLKRMALHLAWLHKEDKTKWDGAMFALEVMGYQVDFVDGHYVITEK